MARKYDIAQMLGDDFEFELTPDALAYELSMDFANQVVKQCDKMGLSLTDLSNLLGLSASTLSEKLNGQNLTLKSIAALALALGCDVRAPELIPNSDAKCSPTETT
jgi:transcriptional regulator with XRE-family HTH domain